MDLRNLVPKEEAIKPLVKREIAIKVEYIDPEGQKHIDAIISRVPDGDGRLKIDRQVALLSGGMWANMPVYSQARLEAIATLAIQLISPPDWLSKWIVEDDDLLFSVWEGAKEHTTLFFRSSVAKSATGEEIKRVVIHSEDLADKLPK